MGCPHIRAVWFEQNNMHAQMFDCLRISLFTFEWQSTEIGDGEKSLVSSMV